MAFIPALLAAVQIAKTGWDMTHPQGSSLPASPQGPKASDFTVSAPSGTDLGPQQPSSGLDAGSIGGGLSSVGNGLSPIVSLFNRDQGKKIKQYGDIAGGLGGLYDLYKSSMGGEKS